MPNYSNGKIYTIRCRTDETIIYVGATTQPLSVRIAEHKRHNRTAISYFVNEKLNGDWTNIYIELYELFPCNSKEELSKREGEITRSIGTINMCIAGRTRKEWWNDNPNYKDKHKEICKSWRENNKEKIQEYRKNSQEERAEYDRNRSKCKCKCECGGSYSGSHKKRHERSNLHQSYLKLKLTI